MFQIGHTISHKSGFMHLTAFLRKFSKHPKPEDTACVFKVLPNGKQAVCVFVGAYCECIALMQAL